MSGIICLVFFLPYWIVPAVYRAPGKKATVPIYKVLVGAGRESISRPTSTEAGSFHQAT